MDEPEVNQEPASQPEGTPPDRGLKTYTADEKLALLQAYDAWTGPMEAFCEQAGVTSASLCKWRRQFRAYGAEGLQPRPNERNTGGTSRAAYSPEERRAAVEAYLKSGQTRDAFRRIWGMSGESLRRWVEVYRLRGPRGLEHPGEGTPGRRPGPRLAASVRGEIERTQREHPGYGLKRIRQWLWRFGGLKVSTGSVRKTLRAAGVKRVTKSGRGRAGIPRVRSFERAGPNELWQSDLTSVVLPRSGRRVYLVVFLDDYSRYVVSWGLAMQQRQELVVEALLEGIQRCGKPREVLTDQGRQYFSWRGKGAFTTLLAKQGIRHVVARSHHPQTVGKCERLWETLQEEFWERIAPGELSGVRAGLVHKVAH